jgi:predicted lipid-binding transport protein (Tim44 family)
MNIVDRVKKILLTPKTEWDVIAAETTPTQQLVVGYVLPLAAVAAVAAFIGQVVIGVSMPMSGTVRFGLLAGLIGLVMSVVMAVVMVFVVGLIADALAPSFGGQKNTAQALKVSAYTFTPVWVLGILNIIPVLGVLGILGAIYAIYLLYLGLPKLMKAPADKAAGYTAVVVLAAIVLWVVVAFVSSMVMMPFMGAAAMLGSPQVKYEKDSSMAKLDEFARKMEQQAKKMEEAQKSGDTGKQMEAALGALGTALSGGKPVDPLQIDALKPFVPEKFAGLPRADLRTERSGVSGLMIAKAEGVYREGDKQVKLDVTDTGGAASLIGMAAWLGVQGEKEDSNRRESTRREGTRIVHEEVDKRGGRNEYTVVLANRFVVSAEGNADIGALKSAVNGLDLAKLEALK